MSNNTRWTKDEELKLLKNIQTGMKFDDMAKIHDRSVSALEMRLKKVIYENIMSGKSTDMLSTSLNLSIDKINQYYYSYKDLMEKHSKNNDDKNNNKQNNDESHKQFGGNNNVISHKHNMNNKNENLNKIKTKMDKIELENKFLKIILENQELMHKLKYLIKDGKIDSSVKKLISAIRGK